MEGGRRGTMVWRSEVWSGVSGILGRMADLADFSYVSISMAIRQFFAPIRNCHSRETFTSSNLISPYFPSMYCPIQCQENT